jgi:hypothetical protein
MNLVRFELWVSLNDAPISGFLQKDLARPRNGAVILEDLDTYKGVIGCPISVQ